MKHFLVSWKHVLINFIWVGWFGICCNNERWDAIYPSKVLKALPFLNAHVDWVEILRCVVEHWVWFCLLSNIHLFPCLWVWSERLFIKLLSLSFKLRSWEHKVLSLLLVDQVLNFLINIHLIKILLSGLLKWQAWI